MASIGYIMLVAYNLILMTFTLGVLILALPIPLRGLKAWSGKLIADSIMAFVLMSLYWTLIQFSDKFPLLFGWTWAAFADWYFHALTLVVGIKAAIAALLAASRPVYLSRALGSLLSPLNTVLNIVLLTFATIGALMIVIRKAYLYLAALGIALYSLPFRLGRSAGASLLAFAIVFNAGLPLLPAFLMNMTGAQPPEMNLLGVAFAHVSVQDWGGLPIRSGLVRVYSYVNGSYKEIARYHVGPDGDLVGKYGSNIVSLPSKAPSYWYLELDGVTFPLYPSPLSPGSLNTTEDYVYKVKLEAPHILYQHEYLVVFTSNPPSQGNTNIEYGENTLRVGIYMSSGEYLEVDAPKGCRVEFNYTGPATPDKGSWYWLGVEGYYLRLTASQAGYFNVTISFSGSCNANPELPPVKDYAFDYLGLTNYSRSLTPKLLMGFVVLPALYLFILSSVTFALARLLGGRERLIPRL
ncbi:MAG: hypothetical protein LRS46_00695 [Desulfurococcales archaeon]|nr:hypothetical protein [Desulfurococcales archaeon]